MRLVAAALIVAAANALPGQAFHRRLPNLYERTADDNRVTALNARLARGELDLPTEGPRGRLRALLAALHVPESSQVLVFSRTSLQRHRISPRNPRALYYGRDAYVGWIPGARSLEVAVGDDALGLAFYTLSQSPDDAPVLVRDDTCLRCHAAGRTRDEPGLLLRSVFPDELGDPIASAGELDEVSARAPLADRWGGWLVTGRFDGPHRGNGLAIGPDERGNFRVEPQAAGDLTELRAPFVFDASIYPRATSDVAALLVLEQQAAAHNRMVRATMQLRYLLDRDRRSDAERDEHGMRARTAALCDDLAQELAATLLLDGEAPLAPHDAAPDPDFARDHAALWPADARGRRLGVADLRERTFSLPLSPMVHSAAFARLPPVLRARVLARLQVAIERGVPPGDVRLDRPTREALREHLAATIPDWPAPLQRRERRQP